MLPSLEVSSETTIQSAACGSGACYYSSTLAFRDTTTPLPMEFNPRKVFVQLFGAGDTPEERATISRRRASVLDMINERTHELQGTLGAQDRAILDAYLESVRETERRIAKASERDLTGIDLPDAPIGELTDFDEQVKLMFDLIALAYQANVTRVASYFMVGEGTNRTYNHIGVPDAFHPLSHHANNKERIEKLVKIQRYHVERFAEFVDKLAKIPDGENSLLDNSMLHVRLEHEQQRPPQQLSAAAHAGRRRRAATCAAASTSRCRNTRRCRTCTLRSSTRPASR